MNFDQMHNTRGQHQSNLSRKFRNALAWWIEVCTNKVWALWELQFHVDLLTNIRLPWNLICLYLLLPVFLGDFSFSLFSKTKKNAIVWQTVEFVYHLKFSGFQQIMV